MAVHGNGENFPLAEQGYVLAAQFDLPYFRAATPDELRKAYESALDAERSAVLEVILDPEEDLRTFQTFQNVRLP